MSISKERTTKVRQTKTAQVCSIVLGAIYFDYDNGGRVQAMLGTDKATALFDDRTSIPSVRVISLSALYYENFYGSYAETEAHKDYIDVQMTLRSEKRYNKIHWYAYRRAQGKLHKRYVGTSDQLTEDRLLKIAKALPTSR